jgi:hypothetical protein
MKRYSSISKAQDLIDYYTNFPTESAVRNILNEEELEKKHILFVGDSFIFGDNLKNNETISHHFKTSLDKSEYSVFNLGCAGGSLDSSLLHLQQWCNSYSDKIHSVYFGITSKARLQYWIDESHHFNYIPGKENIPNPKNTVGDEIFLAKSLNKLVAIQEFQTIVKLNHTIQHLKTLSQLHNFNVMSFYTTDERVPDKEMNEIKKLEDEKFIIYDKENSWTYQTLPNKTHLRIDKYFLSKTNSHWSSIGNKYVVDNILCPKTENWYP